VIVNVFQVRRAEGGSKTFKFHEESFPPLQLGNESYRFLAPLEVELKTENVGKSLLVNGKISSVIAVICSRCLKEFSYNLEIAFEDEWVPAEFASEAEDDGILVFEKDEFPIDDRIVEHMLLQLPFKFLCSEDCRGLCLKCGADRNVNPCACSTEDIDPRLEILSKWNKGV